MNLIKRHIITVTGPDKPGLVSGITSKLAEENISLEDVSMTRLSGNFAMIILIHGDLSAGLIHSLQDTAKSLGLVINFDTAVENNGDDVPNYYISVSGINRVGILHQISTILAEHKINILELTTRLLESTEVPVYIVRIEAHVPGDQIEELKFSMNNLSNESGLDVSLQEINSESF